MLALVYGHVCVRAHMHNCGYTYLGHSLAKAIKKKVLVAIVDGVIGIFIVRPKTLYKY